MILLKKLFQDIFLENEPYFKEKNPQESHIIDPNGTVLPQPPELGIIRNVGNYENLDDGAHEDDEQDQNEEERSIDVRRLTRTSWPSTRFRDYITYSVTYSIKNFISYENISSQHKTYLKYISKEQEQKKFKKR
jgi:hypothetical protein